jgi:hypothetical protein
MLQPSVRVGDRISILNRMQEIDPKNKDILTSLAFLNAMDDDWKTALEHIEAYLKMGNREHKSYLSLLILKLGAMNKQGSERSTIEQSANLMLEQIQNDWYRSMIRTLLAKSSEVQLTERAAGSPEYLLTAHFALGLWLEGNGQAEKAVNHYKEALGTYLDGWWEYEFAKVRIRRLRAP